jgi:hypothetical protein
MLDTPAELPVPLCAEPHVDYMSLPRNQRQGAVGVVGRRPRLARAPVRPRVYAPPVIGGSASVPELSYQPVSEVLD